jgi:hypothetical protein
LPQRRQGIRHRYGQILIDAGIPVAINGAGATTLPDGRDLMERIQGTQVLWKIMAAINLEVPIHKEV